MSASAPRSARPVLLGILVVLTLTFAACGGTDDSPAGGSDVATAIPANAPVALTATVRPEGDLKHNALDIAKRLLNNDDPERVLQSLVDGKNSPVTQLNYKEDVKPWLGPDVGLFITDLRGKNSDGAIVFQTTDAEKTLEVLGRQIAATKPGKRQPLVTEKAHNGQRYKASDSDMAHVVIDDLAVVGSERGVKRAIDTLKSGESLHNSDRRKNALTELGSGDTSLGYLFIDVKAAVDQTGNGGAVAKDRASALGKTLENVGIEKVAVGLGAEKNRLVVDVASPLTKPLPDTGDGAAALGLLPADSWVAIGLGDVAKAAEAQIANLSGLAGLVARTKGQDLNTLIEQVNRALKINVRQDLLAWMGSGALFARGRTFNDLGAGLIVESKDPAATKRAIPILRRLFETLGARVGVNTDDLDAPGVDTGFAIRVGNFPFAINVAAAGSRFVVAIGDGSLQTVLTPPDPLTQSEPFATGADALGTDLKPSVFVNVAPILAFLDGLGFGNSATVQKQKPRLLALKAIVGGSDSTDTTARQRLVLTLNEK